MLKRFWNWLLGKTTVDEKIVEKVQQIKVRAERIEKEIGDVVVAVKEVGKQASDVTKAAAGAPRRGRKPAAKKNAPAPTATAVEATPAAKRTASSGRKSSK
jgi:hypothetical protein